MMHCGFRGGYMLDYFLAPCYDFQYFLLVV